MIEIRIHGRGGQGAVIASQILAQAAFQSGMHVQAFPSFGSERRGAPVTAFLRLDQTPIRLHSEIYRPDGVIVLDPSFLSLQLVDVCAGLKAGGWILINTPKAPDAFSGMEAFRVATVDASGIARSHGLGSATAPIVNTVPRKNMTDWRETCPIFRLNSRWKPCSVASVAGGETGARLGSSVMNSGRIYRLPKRTSGVGNELASLPGPGGIESFLTLKDRILLLPRENLYLNEDFSIPRRDG